MLGQQEVELEGLKKYSVALHELELITDEFKRTQAANMDKLAQILPTQAELPDLIVQMEAIALASSFRLTSIDITHGLPQERSQAKSVGKKGESETIDATEINPAVKVLNISLSVEGGDYPELKELLGNIEKHLRIMDVTGISFSSGLEVSGYDIPIRTYYYEPDL